MKILIKAIFFLVILLNLPLALQAATVDRIIATVNDDPITLYDLDRAMVHSKAIFKKLQGTELAKEFKSQRDFALKRLIEERLLFQELEKRSIQVSDEELEKAIAGVLERNKMSQKQLSKELKSKGTSFEAYREDLRRQIGRMRLVGKVIGPQVQVSDSDLEKFFAQNPDQFGKFQTVEIAQVIIPLEAGASDAELAKAQSLASEVIRKAQKGSNLVELARKYDSNSEAAKRQTYSASQLAPQMAAVLANLNPGQISKPVRTSLGLHVIKLYSRQTMAGEEFQAIREQLKERVQQVKIEEELQKYLEDLKGKSHIVLRNS